MLPNLFPSPRLQPDRAIVPVQHSPLKFLSLAGDQRLNLSHHPSALSPFSKVNLVVPDSKCMIKAISHNLLHRCAWCFTQYVRQLAKCLRTRQPLIPLEKIDSQIHAPIGGKMTAHN